MISPARVICLLGSIMVHVLLLRSNFWSGMLSPAQIELQPGQSAIELTLLASVASKPAEPEPKSKSRAELKPETRDPKLVPEPQQDQLSEPPPPAPVVEKPTQLSAPEPIKEPPTPEPEPEPEQKEEPLESEPAPRQESETKPEPKPVQETPAEPTAPAAESVQQDADLKQKGVETAPQRLQSFQPRYPRLSRRRGEEGTVKVALTVTTTGKAVDIRISKSSGYRLLDNAALGAVRKSRFKPATQNGQPIDSPLEQSFIFRLEDQ